jgi:hypothetical protein
MHQASVVAFYDAVPARLAGLITRVQRLAAHEIASFAPRSLRQVHATIIAVDPVGPRSSQRRGPSVAPPDSGMDLSGLLDHLRGVFAAAPLQIQFGGFADRDYAFTSRSKRLYERSLTLQQGLVTLIGWPVGTASAGAEPLQVLDAIRRGCQAFGVAHKYHDAPETIDPDLYIVVGDYDHGAASTGELEQAARAARRMLRRHPVRIRAGMEELQAVAYTDRRLPTASSIALPLASPTVHTELARLLQQR